MLSINYLSNNESFRPRCTQENQITIFSNENYHLMHTSSSYWSHNRIIYLYISKWINPKSLSTRKNTCHAGRTNSIPPSTDHTHFIDPLLSYLNGVHAKTCHRLCLMSLQHQSITKTRIGIARLSSGLFADNRQT